MVPESYAMLLAGLGLMGEVMDPEREQKRLNYYPSHESMLLPNKSR